MNRELTNRLMREELENFPINRFLKSDGSINTRRIKLLNKDFQQDALDMIFLHKALKVHGIFFGYEETKFLTLNQQVKIYCPDCDSYFMQVARDHLAGSGCPNCKFKVVTRHTELGDFVVPCQYRHYRIEDDHLIFYTSKGKELKFAIAKRQDS